MKGRDDVAINKASFVVLLPFCVHMNVSCRYHFAYNLSNKITKKDKNVLNVCDALTS